MIINTAGSRGYAVKFGIRWFCVWNRLETGPDLMVKIELGELVGF